MLPYPSVVSEEFTLRAVLDGASIARYGDGEIRLCLSYPAKKQRAERTLTKRLQEILAGNVPENCLVGIPNLNSDTPKAPFWEPYRDMTRPFLVERPYVSSFITRPDSAPWIDTPEYWDLVESLWRDQDVTIIHGGRHGLSALDLASAKSVDVIEAPERDAWSDYARLKQQILDSAWSTPRRRVLLCLGPTATVLAADLSVYKDLHAIDIGHLALFWRKHLKGEPMIVTDGDKAA